MTTFLKHAHVLTKIMPTDMAVLSFIVSLIDENARYITGKLTLLHRQVPRGVAGQDPAQNTAAQRSWMYAQDPVIKYHNEGTPVAARSDGLSISTGDKPVTIRWNTRCRSAMYQDTHWYSRRQLIPTSSVDLGFLL